MASQIDICNRALIRLGAPTITSIDDNTKSAKLCKKLYDMVVSEVHGEGPWSNAVKRVALAQNATAPAFGYDSQYTLPSDLIKVIAINDITPGDYDHRVENGNLLISLDAVSIQYIALLSTPGSFGNYLTNSIVDLLSAEMAYAFTGNGSLATSLRQNYMSRVRENLAMDNQQGSKDIIQVRDLTDVR